LEYWPLFSGKKHSGSLIFLYCNMVTVCIGCYVLEDSKAGAADIFFRVFIILGEKTSCIVS